MRESDYVALFRKHGAYPTHTKAQEALSAVVNSLKEVMLSIDSVHLEGLGKFEAREFIGRICGIPGEKKIYTSTPHATLHFKADEVLKTKVNGGKKVEQIFHASDEREAK